jgi:hypothetical protein
MIPIAIGSATQRKQNRIAEADYKKSKTITHKPIPKPAAKDQQQ